MLSACDVGFVSRRRRGGLLMLDVAHNMGRLVLCQGRREETR
jgi:hypothetical protein